MKKLMGGAGSLVLGAILFSCFADDFVFVCLGVIPVKLIVGGSVAIYLSYVRLSEELNAQENSEALGKDENQGQEKDQDQSHEENSVQPAFWGNTQSLIFHDPQCNFAQSKKCTQPFPDKESAISAGYSPCSICLLGSS